MSRFVENIWYGQGPAARGIRFVLAPAEWLFGSVSGRRNAAYDKAASGPEAGASDRGGSLVQRAVLPCLSIGNLTVGGTGKTPFAAWCVRQLRLKGANPAIVMRGYGDDEWKVHSHLNPGAPVVVSPDRAAGVVTAMTRGADCAVLDDAFQHRRISRVSDLVLVSADQYTDHVYLLPRGPYREKLSALTRASAVIITAKSASRQKVAALSGALSREAPHVKQIRVRLLPGTIRLAASLLEQPRGLGTTGAGLTHEAGWLSGRRVAAISGVGNPASFEEQLSGLGAVVVQSYRFGDHHDYTAHEVQRLVRELDGEVTVVCTLKDAVKLSHLWPQGAPPLWYVTQTVSVESGADTLDREFERVLSARRPQA